MKERMHIAVNHEVLLWAREAIALNRTNASERTGISTKRLVQLEEGEKQPTLEELKVLSKTYKRTIATLLLTTPPKEKPLPPDRRTVDSKDLGNFHEKTIMAIRKARALVVSLIELKQDAGIAIPSFRYKASIRNNPAIIANQLRKEWNLDEIRQLGNSNDALEAYIEKAESLGVAVFQLSLTQDHLRGFSMVDEIVPIIGIKRGGEPATAKIFTLFHELGHVLLNDGGLCDLSANPSQQIEKWCNAFSAEMLIPASELLQMNSVTEHRSSREMIWAKKELIELGNHFHVGPLAILRSLLENKLTTPAYYKDRHQAWNRPSFGRAKHPEGRNIAKETIKEKAGPMFPLRFQHLTKTGLTLKTFRIFWG